MTEDGHPLNGQPGTEPYLAVDWIGDGYVSRWTTREPGVSGPADPGWLEWALARGNCTRLVLVHPDGRGELLASWEPRR